MTSNFTVYQRKKTNTNILKSLALLSIAVYIFLMVVFETLNSPLASLASYGIYACLGFCGIYILSREKIKVYWLFVALFVFGVLLSVSALYTKTAFSFIIPYIRRYWTSLILIFVIANVLDSPRDINFLLNVLIISGAALSLYLYTFYGWEYLINAEERLDDAFGNQNNTAVRCAFSVIFAIYKTVTSNKRILRFLWLVPAAICIPAIMFLASRKAILMIAVALVTLLFTYSKNKNFVKKMMVILIILVALWYVIQNVPAFSIIKDRLDNTFAFFSGDAGEDSIADLNRVYYIKASLMAFLESPVIGNGFYYSQYLLGTYSHNNYIELLLNNGIIGFCVYYFCYVKMFREAGGLKKTSRLAYVFIITTMMTFVAMDVGVVSYFNRYTLIILMLCCVTCAVHQNAIEENAGAE